jgi:hypothetical protein
VPLARDLHPEFGYVGSAPRLCRRVGLVSVFIAFGLVAGASGVAVFMTPDPDPMNAMALAPAEALIAPSPTLARPAQARTVEGRAIPADASRPPCRDYGDDCTSLRIHKPRPLQPLNERPAIAAVPIGHRDNPSVLPAPETVAAIRAAPPQPIAAPTNTGEAPAAAAPSAPAAPAAKPAQTRTRHARREGSSSGRESNPSARESHPSARERYSSVRPGGTPGLGGYAGFWGRPW